MRLIPYLICIVVILHGSYAPPVTKSDEKDSEIKDDLEQYMEYHRYLREVVQALESDPKFREKLESADEEDIRSGKIADQLDFVSHNVRSQLDEIKRRELERLRHLATKQFELTNHLDPDKEKVAYKDHLDDFNPHTFEIEDLKKLIKKTTTDLEEADKKRKEEFKEYEMQKEYEKYQKLEHMDDTQKKEYQEKLNQEEKAKKKHEQLHHPGSKQQYEEVWEKQDHMQEQQFDPNIFFMMHDVDGNGVWDANEVKALFIKELDKMYGPGGPNKDLHERAEEMERMREHVFHESDTNRDGLIDFNEFMDQTKRSEFQKDEGWQSIDENQIYTPNEYQEFEKRRLAELKYLQERGLVDANGNAIPGAQQQIRQALHEQQLYLQQQQHQMPQYHGQAPMQYHPGQAMPQGQYQQVPSYQGHPQGVPQQYPGQVPQGQPQHQYPAGQVPHGQPQQQYSPGQVPQGQPQQQYPPGQVPQGQPQRQYPAGQVPQGHPQGFQQNQNLAGQIPQGMPQQNQHPAGQAPQVQYQGQVPPQGQLPVQNVQQGVVQNNVHSQEQIAQQVADPVQQQAPPQQQAAQQGQMSQGQTQGQAPPKAQ